MCDDAGVTAADSPNGGTGRRIAGIGWRGPICLAIVLGSVVAYLSELSTGRVLQRALDETDALVAACVEADRQYRQAADVAARLESVARTERLSRWRGVWLRTLESIVRAIPPNVYVRRFEGGPIDDDADSAIVLVAFETADERDADFARRSVVATLASAPGVVSSVLLPGSRLVGENAARRLAFTVRLDAAPLPNENGGGK